MLLVYVEEENYWATALLEIGRALLEVVVCVIEVFDQAASGIATRLAAAVLESAFVFADGEGESGVCFGCVAEGL